MSDNLVSLENVSFFYPNGNILLQNVSFNINRGDFLGVIGSNGAGKSTLIKLILGRLKPTEGKVNYPNITEHNYRRSGKIGYLSQEARNFNSQFPGTVKEVVRAQLSVIPTIKKQNIDLESQKVLDLVGLVQYENYSIGQLSGGQQQRALLARTLVTKPDILILDEPMTGIDSQSQEIIWQVLKNFNRQFQTTIVMISHNISEIIHNTTKIALLDNKKVSFKERKDLREFKIDNHNDEVFMRQIVSTNNPSCVV